MFVIQNTKYPELFWNNEFGWVEKESAQRFSEGYIKELNLPVDGIWVKE